MAVVSFYYKPVVLICKGSWKCFRVWDFWWGCGIECTLCNLVRILQLDKGQKKENEEEEKHVFKRTLYEGWCKSFQSFYKSNNLKKCTNNKIITPPTILTSYTYKSSCSILSQFSSSALPFHPLRLWDRTLIIII